MMDAIDIVGCLAGIGGLIFSVLAWIAAKSASTAAHAARDAVYRENLKQELGEMTVLANQMLSAIRRRDSETVSTSATTLLASTEHAISRWGHNLSEDQLLKLKNVPELIASINRTVLLQDIPTDISSLRRMVDQCQNAMRTMNSVLGSAQIEPEPRQ